MKYSRQRELILNYINESIEHPNVALVYDYAKKYIPNISLGTVYRNLNLLTDMDLIKKIVTPDDGVRFDKIENPHSHIYCLRCNQLIDISNEQFSAVSNFMLEETGHNINSNYTVFVGMCCNCLKRKGEKQNGTKRK